jgi:DNA-binding NarL/FixJ family response regulator
MTLEEVIPVVPAVTIYQPPCRECGLRKAVVTADALLKFPADLRPKERRMIVLLCTGMQNKEIATRTETTEQVVKNTFRIIYQKVGVSDRTQLLIRMMKFKYEGV